MLLSSDTDAIPGVSAPVALIAGGIILCVILWLLIGKGE